MMEMVVRNLMRNSMKLHNWTTLTNYAATHCRLQNFVNLVQDTSTCKKELGNSEKHVQNFLNLNTDVQNIKNIQQNMENTDIKNVIKYMYTFRTLLDKQSKKEIRNSEQFRHTCKLILSNVQCLNNHEIIEVLSLLFSFKVSHKSLLITTLLQYIRTVINDLSVKQIIYLFYLLERAKDTQKSYLIKSLLIALPLVFPNRVKLEFDESNYSLSALSFASYIKDEDSLMYIIRILRKDDVNISIDHLTHNFDVLYTLPVWHKFFIKFQNKLNKVIIANCQSFEFEKIRLLLHHISIKVFEKEMQFYHEDVIDALCNAIINKNTSFVQSLDIQAILNSINYSSIPFLNYLTTKFIENPDVLEVDKRALISNLIKGLSIANYKPKSWKQLQSMLLNYVIKNNNSFDDLTHIVHHLTALDCYSPQLLEQIFTSYHCTDYKKKESNISTVLRLYQCVKTFYLEYNGIIFTEDMVNEMMPPYKCFETIPSLEENLEEIMGGAEYIKNGLRTKLGHYIHHTLVMQPDGSPVIINDNNDKITFVEDLVLPRESHKLLILIYPQSAYSINLQNMVSTWNLNKKSIEALVGRNVLVVNRNFFDRPVRERKVYLQRAIDYFRYLKYQ